MNQIHKFCTDNNTAFRKWISDTVFCTTDDRIFEVNYHDSGMIMGIDPV